MLHTIVDNYNKTPHRSIGMAPIKVNRSNTEQVFKKLYKDYAIKTDPRLRVGDKVRIARLKTLFEKGYTPNWTEEIYVISAVRQKAGIVWYKVEKLNGEEVPGIKNYYQLNLVTKHVADS